MNAQPQPEPDRSQLFAWQVLEADGRWGSIAAVVLPGMTATPLIARSRQMADRFRGLATAHQLSSGKRVRLARYDFAREEEVITSDE